MRLSQFGLYQKKTNFSIISWLFFVTTQKFENCWSNARFTWLFFSYISVPMRPAPLRCTIRPRPRRRLSSDARMKQFANIEARWVEVELTTSIYTIVREHWQNRKCFVVYCLFYFGCSYKNARSLTNFDFLLHWVQNALIKNSIIANVFGYFALYFVFSLRCAWNS